MDHRLHDDDSCNLAEDSGIHPIIGMESVVATVSGYHGTERFKVIKLIACTGANYVGAMDKSITHLVCWQFEGKKYDLARKLETLIISHCWFEDCLKEGRRLPEGPYTLKSGQEVGRISWEEPEIFEGFVEKIRPYFGERNVESNHYEASHSAKGKEINLVCLKWSDSHLLKENYFHGWDTKRSLSDSQGGRKSRKTIKRSHQSGRHQIANMDDPGSWRVGVECRMQGNDKIEGKKKGNERKSGSEAYYYQPECSSRSSTVLKHRRNFHDDANCESYADSTEESNHAVKITESAALDKLLRKKATERIFYENEESRRIGHEEDIVEPNDFSNLVNSDSSERYHVLTVEGDSKAVNPVEARDTDLRETGEYKDERSGGDALSAPSCLDQQTELSCVICWTEFCSLRGVLPCGHRFCYSCIQEWANCMASRGKVSTCPLCKTNFTNITQFEELASEQKIFSQSIPCSSSKLDIFCLPGKKIYDTFRGSSSDTNCFECQNREPEDLLLSCHICRSQWVHSCCLDPPLIPWTCIHCRDHRMLYQRFR